MKFGFDLPSDLVDNGQTDNGACLYYKLTYEFLRSCKLIKELQHTDDQLEPDILEVVIE